jgi:hypothetical protein
MPQTKEGSRFVKFLPLSSWIGKSFSDENDEELRQADVCVMNRQIGCQIDP